MALQVYAVAYDDEGNRVVYSGNMPLSLALQITQTLLIEEERKKAVEEAMAASRTETEPNTTPQQQT